MFTLTQDRSNLCKPLLAAFNQSLPAMDDSLIGKANVTSHLLLWSPLSIDWHITGRGNFSIGRADIDNDGQDDWLIEQITITGRNANYGEEIYRFPTPPPHIFRNQVMRLKH